MPDLIVTLNGREYELEVEATLADLTGAETLMLEEYLSGWEHFGSGTTRSAIVTIWLAKRQAGEQVSLEEIEGVKGLLFGGALELSEVNGGPPAEAAVAATPSTPSPSESTSGIGDSKSDSA